MGRASHDLVIIDDRQGKELLFANSVVKKKHGVGWPPKTMRNSSILKASQFLCHDNNSPILPFLFSHFCNFRDPFNGAWPAYKHNITALSQHWSRPDCEARTKSRPLCTVAGPSAPVRRGVLWEINFTRHHRNLCLNH